MAPDLGIVAIGRNEGDRLRQCLGSIVGHAAAVVYVDSGSTDGSIALARALGADVVELDLSLPFTAARARNAGLERLLQGAPGVRFVQFVDGDCEVASGWLERARRELEARPDVAVVCGRRRERYPDRSIYNRLADLEWDTPIGEAKACGGDAMMRVAPLREAGGYDPTLIAGEEPELCVRLRRRGWKVLRLDAEMTLHDLAMTRFGQWWRRSTRAGHAYAEGAARHGRPPERHGVREVSSTVIWGLLLPLGAVALVRLTRGASLALWLAYPVQCLRITRHGRVRGWPPRDALLYALACVIAKFPQATGAVRYWVGRMAGRPRRLIEYKGSELSVTSDSCRPNSQAPNDPVAIGRVPADIRPNRLEDLGSGAIDSMGAAEERAGCGDPVAIHHGRRPHQAPSAPPNDSLVADH